MPCCGLISGGKRTPMSVDFDAMLPHIGEMGKYQLGLYLLMCIPATLPAAFLAFNQVFLSAEPEHWCNVTAANSMGNLSLGAARALTIPRVDLGPDHANIVVYERCLQYDVNFTELFESLGGEWPAEADPEWPVTECREGWVYDRSEYKDTLVTELDLVCDRSWWPSTSTALFYVGSLFGNVLFGFIADRRGRRTSFFCLLFMSVSISILTSFSPNYVVYTVLRTINGFTFPALFQIPFILTLEIMGPAYRTFAGMMICLFFAVALMLLSLLAYIFNSWFPLALVTSLPFASLFSYWFFVPESPRWLLSYGRIDEAEVIIQSIAKWNGKQISPNFAHEFVEAEQRKKAAAAERAAAEKAAAATAEKEATDTAAAAVATATESNSAPSSPLAAASANAAGAAQGESEPAGSKSPNNGSNSAAPAATSPVPSISGSRPPRDPSMLVLLLYYPVARRNFLLITFNWLVNAIVYNGLSFYSANLNVNSFVGFFLGAAVEVPSYFLGWYAMDKWGRRWILFFTMVTGGIAGISCIMVPIDASPWIVVSLAMVGKFQIAVSFAVIYVYAGEMMPTVVRSEAMGISSFFSGFGLLIFPYINVLGKYSYVLPLVIMGTLSVIGGVVALFLPETLGQHLPNTLEEGEAFGSNFKVCSCPDVQSAQHGVTEYGAADGEEMVPLNEAAATTTLGGDGDGDAENSGTAKKSTRIRQPNGRVTNRGTRETDV